MRLLERTVSEMTKTGVFPHKSRLHSRMESFPKNRARDHPGGNTGHFRFKSVLMLFRFKARSKVTCEFKSPSAIEKPISEWSNIIIQVKILNKLKDSLPLWKGIGH